MFVHNNIIILVDLKNFKDVETPELLNRRSSQFLMPQLKDVNKWSKNFDLYPAFNLEPNSINMGYYSLADYLSDQKLVCLDGFSGVNWSYILNELYSAITAKGMTVQLINLENYLKPENAIKELVAPFLGDDDSVWGKRANLSLSDFFDQELLKTIEISEDSDLTLIYGCGSGLVSDEALLIYFDLPKNELQYRMRANSVTNFGVSSYDEDYKTYKHFYFVDWVLLNAEKKKLSTRIDVIVDSQHQENPSWTYMKTIREALHDMSKSLFRVRPWFEPGAWGGEWIKDHIQGLNKDVPNYAWAFSLIVPENGLIFQSDNRLLEISFDFIMNQEGQNILGAHYEHFGNEFPIRFNFLDTFNGGNLSIQCHPRLKYIQEVFGENITQDECYYILDCEENAGVYLGFQDDINPENFRGALEKSQEEGIELNITNYVQLHNSKKHDLFLIPNGTIHSAGIGNMVLEISATPYIFTFKMYDWVRLDLDGKPRPINIDHAFKNLRFDLKGERVKEELFSNPQIIESNGDFEIIHYPTHEEHFYDVRRFDFNKSFEMQTLESCQVMMLVEGEHIQVETENGLIQELGYAETFVIPAAAGKFKLTNFGSGWVKVINAYLK